MTANGTTLFQWDPGNFISPHTQKLQETDSLFPCNVDSCVPVQSTVELLGAFGRSGRQINAITTTLDDGRYMKHLPACVTTHSDARSMSLS